MEIKIITVGKIGDRSYHSSCQEYLKRLRRYARVSMESVKPEKGRNLSSAEIIARESKRLGEKIDGSDFSFALDKSGDVMTSVDFAHRLQQLSMQSSKRVNFLIGGPYGLSENLLHRVQSILSLSRMTFAHELAAVILLEQIYRGFSISRGEKYHK
jgi:23S rRNA (pseudouridine1915-N3)-methyltransferase